MRDAIEKFRKKILPILLLLLIISLVLYAFFRIEVFGIIFWTLFSVYIVYFILSVIITFGNPKLLN